MVQLDQSDLLELVLQVLRAIPVQQAPLVLMVQLDQSVQQVLV
jgi:hypothetical protein